ncbi:metabotropic glutamate receptor 1-like [Choloepus didactylus]|uniref:metabotropic glutamate receptor 1-like n=1 Tax=Choloepus didactylus TaxID=27675 RepID=UPI00189D4840|nr:metabotropic glutamate receptor 1-like [Choloepus didactylus]
MAEGPAVETKLLLDPDSLLRLPSPSRAGGVDGAWRTPGAPARGGAAERGVKSPCLGSGRPPRGHPVEPATFSVGSGGKAGWRWAPQAAAQGPSGRSVPLHTGPAPRQVNRVCLLHSSNGKSVSWSEPGGRPAPRGQAAWQRLSVHVRSGEPACNQTAVIKPLTESFQGSGKSLAFSDASTKTLYSVGEQGDAGPPLFGPAGSPGPALPAPRPLPAVPAPAPAPLATPAPQAQAPPSGALQGSTRVPGVPGVPGVHGPPCAPALLGPPCAPALLGTPCALGPPCAPPPPLRLQPLPLALGAVREEPGSPAAAEDEDDDEDDEEEEEHFRLLQEFVAGHARREEASPPAARRPSPDDDSPALTPPSPFRDSAASGSSAPSSPASESGLCPPPDAAYAAAVLRDYKQSSSTL